MEISVTDFSATIGASVLKFCVHFQVGKVYCVNEDDFSHFAFFFQFFIFILLSFLYNTYGHFFLSKISQQPLELRF